MPDTEPTTSAPTRPPKQADARHSESALLQAAATAFIDVGIDAPMRACVQP